MRRLKLEFPKKKLSSFSKTSWSAFCILSFPKKISGVSRELFSYFLVRMSSKRNNDSAELGLPDDGEATKKHAGGRPKGPPKLDLQYNKKFNDICTGMDTLSKTLKSHCTTELLKDGIKNNFESNGTIELGVQGFGILQFLEEEECRNTGTIKEKQVIFDTKMGGYVAECGNLSESEDNYIASIRKADPEKLEKHKKFIDVCQQAITYYEECFSAVKSTKAVRDTLIRDALKEIRDGEKEKMLDFNRYASAQSQMMDDIPEEPVVAGGVVVAGGSSSSSGGVAGSVAALFGLN